MCDALGNEPLFHLGEDGEDRFVGAMGLEEPIEFGPFAAETGGVLGVDLLAEGLFERTELQCPVLIDRGDADITDAHVAVTEKTANPLIVSPQRCSQGKKAPRIVFRRDVPRRCRKGRICMSFCINSEYMDSSSLGDCFLISWTRG